MSAFINGERLRQAAHFESAGLGGQVRLEEPWRLQAGLRAPNFAPDIREAIEAYWTAHGITWHRHVGHGLSSQAACVNFLAPLARQPELLARVVGQALGIAPPRMLPADPSGAGDWYVDFEWTGTRDYLGEWGGRAPTRGANVTSADAFVRFEHDGVPQALLIEWKYTESYGAPVPAGRERAGHATRAARYGAGVLAPNGPIRPDLGLKLDDFFWEPFYQLLRQQMLAWRMEHDPEEPARQVRVLHVSPGANRALRKVTAPRLRELAPQLAACPDDAFAVFGALLVDPDAFVSRTIEEVFSAVLAEAQQGPTPARRWADYVGARYGSILGPLTSAAG